MLRSHIAEIKSYEGSLSPVEEGKIVGLLGLNGAGKSTLLRGLASVLSFDSGDVRLNDRSLRGDSLGYKSLIGFQPELPSLHPAMTVKEHLQFYGGLRGIHAHDLSKRIDQLLEELSLLPLTHSPCRELSQGESQRLSFAIATLHYPKLLLLDEPTRGLDPRQLAFLRSSLQQERSSRITVLSTHHLHEAKMLCDQIVILANGSVDVLDRELLDNDDRLERYFVQAV